MKVIYEKDDLLPMLKKMHGYSGSNQVKVDHSTQHVLDVDIVEGQVIVTMGQEEDDE